jgi:hypothetical protein
MFIRSTFRLALATATAVSLTGGLLTLSVSTASAATPAKYADDFNGDGYRDYAVAGLGGDVAVTYGTATGTGTTTKTFTQSSAGIPGTVGDAGGYGDAFGEDIATADLNRDGYADLAVADFTEKVSGKAGSGAVTILWGRKTGLTGTDATRLKVTARSGQGFGKEIETGDFNGDGKADLAIANAIDSVYVYRGGFARSGTTGKVTKHTRDDNLEPTGLVAGKVTKDKATDLYLLGQGYHSDKMTQDAWFLRGGSTIKSGKVTVVNGSTPTTAPPVWSPTSTRTATATSRSATPGTTTRRARWSSGAAAAPARRRSTGSRSPLRAWPRPPRRASTSAPTSPPGTPTATATRTWRSACPTRRSAR